MERRVVAGSCRFEEVQAGEKRVGVFSCPVVIRIGIYVGNDVASVFVPEGLEKAEDRRRLRGAVVTSLIKQFRESVTLH